jgi:hypothetical protein
VKIRVKISHLHDFSSIMIAAGVYGLIDPQISVPPTVKIRVKISHPHDFSLIWIAAGVYGLIDPQISGPPAQLCSIQDSLDSPLHQVV